MVLPMGGSSLQEWVNHNYLRKLGIPEYHIYDSDCTNAHQQECDLINQRTDGSSARMTSKREMENYIHPDAIRAIYGANFEIDDRTDVPHIISDYLRSQNLRGQSQKYKKKTQWRSYAVHDTRNAQRMGSKKRGSVLDL